MWSTKLERNIKSRSKAIIRKSVVPRGSDLFQKQSGYFLNTPNSKKKEEVNQPSESLDFHYYSSPNVRKVFGIVSQSIKKNRSSAMRSNFKMSGFSDVSPIKKTDFIEQTDFKEILKLMRSKEKSEWESRQKHVKETLQENKNKINQKNDQKNDLKNSQQILQTQQQKNIQQKKVSFGNTTTFIRENNPFGGDSTFQEDFWVNFSDSEKDKENNGDQNDSIQNYLQYPDQFNVQAQQQQQKQQQQQLSQQEKKEFDSQQTLKENNKKGKQKNQQENDRKVNQQNDKQANNENEKLNEQIKEKTLESSPCTSKLRINQSFFKELQAELSFENLDKSCKALKSQNQQVDFLLFNNNKQNDNKDVKVNKKYQNKDQQIENQEPVFQYENNNVFLDDIQDVHMDIEQNNEPLKDHSSINKKLNNSINVNYSQFQYKKPQPKSKTKSKPKMQQQKILTKELIEECLGESFVSDNKNTHFQHLKNTNQVWEDIWQYQRSFAKNKPIIIDSVSYPYFLFYAHSIQASLKTVSQNSWYCLRSKGEKSLTKNSGFTIKDLMSSFQLHPFGFSSTPLLSFEVFDKIGANFNKGDEIHIGIEISKQEKTFPIKMSKKQRIEIFTWVDYWASLRFSKSSNNDEFISLYKELPTVIQEDTEICIYNDDYQESIVLFKYVL